MELSIGRLKGHNGASSGGSETGLVALVGPGTEFEGSLKAAAGDVCLNSVFKGKVTSEGTVTVDNDGDVAAELLARNINIAGKLKGNAKASEKLEIKARGVVLGNITTPVLVIEPGGFFEGQCHMPIPNGEQTAAKEEQNHDQIPVREIRGL
jgi:cytoskeletal protein CcmA (bactofilin family)